MNRRDILSIGLVALGPFGMRPLVARADQTEPLLHVTTSDGVSIALEKGGSGPSLLLIHGSGAFRKSWVRLAPLLQDRFTTYAMDRRGHGESTDGSAYSLEREAKDLAEVVATLPQPVFVLGHSYGAIVTLEALRLTNKIKRAVVYEPPIPVTDGIERTSPEAVCAKLATGDNEGTLLAFFRDYVKLPPPLIEGLRKDPSWAVRIKLAPTLCREATIVSTYHFETDRFFKLETPTLFLLGSESAPQMATSVKTVEGSLPRSQLHVLAGQQHDAMFTAPSLLAKEVGDFLSA
jgi:pimeloyl-ACP methyl ester carboxylesterase